MRSSNHRLHRSVILGLFLSVVWLVLTGAGCSGKVIPQGGLMLVVRTDGTLSQATRLHLEVTPTTGGAAYRSADYALPLEATLPTTLGIATNGSATASVAINASLWAGSTLLDDRENLIFQIPTDRVAELDIVFAAKCTPLARVIDGAGGSTCASGQTCDPKTGTCVSTTIQGGTLPTYRGNAGGPLGLDGLAISAGTLSPAFDPKVLSYTVIPSARSLGVPFVITPTASAGTSVTVNGAPVGSGEASAALDLALLTPTPVDVAVTPSGGATTHYAIVVPAVQEAYVKASNARANAGFGAVALSADGNTLAVGSSGESSAATGIDGNQADTSAVNAGAVYVFTRVGATWAQQAYIKASNTRAGADFGLAVALSADGNTLAVGSYTESSAATGINGSQADTSASQAGAVYVFTRVGATWSQQAYVKASNTRANAFFALVALSADGNTLAVGSPQESSAATGINGDQADTSAPEAGAVYIFTRVGATWSQQAYIKASNTRRGSQFSTVALSADGNTLAVGAYLESSAATGINGNQADYSASLAGAVYIFTRVGATWAQQAYVKASNTQAAAEFGIFLALSADGNTLAVGSGEPSAARGINGNQAAGYAAEAGAVYVFSRVGTTWAQQAYVKASNTREKAWFGLAVALAADGNTLAVGSYQESSAAAGINGNQADTSAANAGAVYMFSRVGATWAQQAYVKASNTRADASFGTTVALSGDGNTLAVGSSQESSAATGINGNQADTSAAKAGAVYVFR
jgi:hypothetical protein